MRRWHVTCRRAAVWWRHAAGCEAAVRRWRAVTRKATGWWRRRGHALGVDDIMALVDHSLDLIVAGTGTSGRMRPAADLSPFLREKGIEFIAEPNSRAIPIYNQKVTMGLKVGACFHLTC